MTDYSLWGEDPLPSPWQSRTLANGLISRRQTGDLHDSRIVTQDLFESDYQKITD